MSIIDHLQVLKGLTVQDAMRRQVNALPVDAPLSQAIRTMIKYKINAVLIAGDWKVTGRDSLTEKWIKTSSPALANLKLLPYRQSASATIACSSGAYTHDVKENDTVTSSQRGVYTIIWEAQAGKKWQVSLVQIEVIAED